MSLVSQQARRSQIPNTIYKYTYRYTKTSINSIGTVIVRLTQNLLYRIIFFAFSLRCQILKVFWSIELQDWRSLFW